MKIALLLLVSLCVFASSEFSSSRSSYPAEFSKTKSVQKTPIKSSPKPANKKVQSSKKPEPEIEINKANSLTAYSLARQDFGYRVVQMSSLELAKGYVKDRTDLVPMKKTKNTLYTDSVKKDMQSAYKIIMIPNGEVWGSERYYDIYFFKKSE